MNRLKAGAALLAASMIAGVFSGCSKTTIITEDAFAKACEKLDLEEMDFRETVGSDPDALEDGYYFTCDSDYIEESAELIDYYLSSTGLSEVIDSDNIESYSFATKCTGINDIDPDDVDAVKDAEIDGAIAFRMTLDDDGYAEDIMEMFEDRLDTYDIDVKELTAKEYSSSAKEGYIRLHIDIARMSELVRDNDDIMGLLKITSGSTARKVLKGLNGDLAVSFEIKGENVFVIAGLALNTDATVYKDFAKAFGVSNDPMKLPMNETFAMSIVEAIAEAANKYFNYIISGVDDGQVTTTTVSTDPGTGETKGKVGIAFPTEDLQRWKQDGDLMKKGLVEAGYEVDLCYAANDTNTQASQISSMISEGCEVIIVAAIESSSLARVLEEAKNNKVVIIAYDRLIQDTPNVDYYVTFDAYMSGVLQGEYIVNALNLDTAKGPFNIEITSGDTADFMGEFFYRGAMDILQPYIDSGKLVVQSGQISLKETSTDGWSTDKAQGRAENIIGAYYLGVTQIDAWLCLNDSTALGVTKALANVYKDKYPIVTGQDCNIENVKNIINGKQSMSVFKDTRTLVDQTVKMAIQVMEGQNVDVNDNSTYNNGAKIIPSYLCMPIVVTKDNYITILVDSGYYTNDQLG